MTYKMLTEKRGPLQGVSVEVILSNAYGPGAFLVEDPEGVMAGLIEQNNETVDTVIELHETDG